MRIPRSLLPVLLIALGGLTSCGGGGSTTIGQENLQTAIAVSIAKQKHELAIVQCPQGVVARKGVTFACTATLATGQQVPFTVTGLDDKGNVHYGGFPSSVASGSTGTSTTKQK
jgi:hypothetical protein